MPRRKIVLALLLIPFLAQAADEPVVEEAAGARCQATYVWQRHGAFPAAYAGPNSLSAEREKSYTFTATAYLGFRPWQGGELYFDPELTQGVPFSNLTGLAGFTSGELTRVAGPSPKVYRQRLFLRQTWNLGGGEESVEGGLNQLAGTADRNRFVLTAGNFSTLDVFDDNAYAKDPRRQFMNWDQMTYAAYDYAADSRGFAWGAAAEWYAEDWVLRFARMTGPKEPNMLPLDFRLGRHYGDQAEIEHDHRWGGLPGKVRLLAWRNRAVLAGFRDAIDYAAGHGGVPDIFKVRHGERTKYGIGINAEQAASDDLGFFLRAMKADGRSETWAFTEADASLSAGLALKGGSWHRGDDTVGLALGRNALSADRRAYLEAGGISFFIGDGALNYRPETVLEGYYSLALGKDTSITADFQRIRNPAYNADRGPASIAALRFHAEF